jgi:hypothetical protein
MGIDVNLIRGAYNAHIRGRSLSLTLKANAAVLGLIFHQGVLNATAISAEATAN